MNVRLTAEWRYCYQWANSSGEKDKSGAVTHDQWLSKARMGFMKKGLFGCDLKSQVSVIALTYCVSVRNKDPSR